MTLALWQARIDALPPRPVDPPRASPAAIAAALIAAAKQRKARA